MSKLQIVYKVAPGRIASSRADGKNYHEGEVIDLSHCTPEEIATLIAIGLVVETKEAKATETKEVSNG